ncbi:MAG: hypothetical protein ABWY05_15470, partial [Noviherbaspirillum sp.]
MLRFLLTQAERCAYDKITVECASDDIGIQSFCAKFFFDQPTSPRRNSNWIAAVEHVSLVLLVAIQRAAWQVQGAACGRDADFASQVVGGVDHFGSPGVSLLLSPSRVESFF